MRREARTPLWIVSLLIRFVFMGTTPVAGRVFAWLDQPLSRRLAISKGYALVAVVLWIGLAIQNAQRQFGSDIWQHVPAINEFMANPLDPDHIYVSGRVPHQSLNAYHLILGFLGSLFGLSAIHTAQIAGLFNAAAILLLFPQFVRSFVTHRRAPVIALLLTTLAWGPNSWRFSGFLNLNSIGFGTPYPSHFAIWMSFLIIWVLRRAIESRSLRLRYLLPMGLGGFLVVNAHPITLGGLGIFAGALALERRSRQGAVGVAVIALSALIGTLIWPFFDLFEIVADWSVFDAENEAMYDRVLMRLAPALLGLWPLLIRYRRDRRDALFLAFTGTLIVYLLGLVLDRATYGRILPFMAMSLHLALAGSIAMWFDRQSRALRRRSVAVGFGLGLLALILASPAVVRMVPHAILPAQIRSDPKLATDFEFVVPIGSIIEQGDVVLAPPEISTPLASVGADLVTFRPVPFLPDQVQRKEDAIDFFSNPTKSLLSKYQVDWIVFVPDRVGHSVLDRLQDLGEVTVLDNVTLVKVP